MKLSPAYVFVATLPYSGYSYVEALFSMNQEAWTTAHVNAYKYFGGVTRIIQCDKMFAKVLEHAGVYKRNEEGTKAFDRFIEAVNHEI